MEKIVQTARLLFENTIHDSDQLMISEDIVSENHLKIHITLSSHDCYRLKKGHGHVLRAITALIQNVAAHYHMRATIIVSE